MRSRATVAWAAYLVPAAGLGLYALAQWISALANRSAVLYGEGAVANAARLARDGIAYLDADPSRFVAANYPPLYFPLASIVDPFVTGRAASIVATLAVAGMVFASARAAGRLAAAALAAGWLALAPVMIWGPALKPDLVALALTAMAVVLLDRRPDLAAIAGFALIFAALAKPTALLPAAALVAWLAVSDRATLVRCGFGAAVAVVATTLAIAAVAPRLRPSAVIPLALLAQLVVGTMVLDPLRVVPGRVPTTGAWSDQLRGGAISVAFHVDGRYLVEDSGLLAKSGIPPVVDDLFLWSRLVERGIIDAEPIVSQVRDGRIDTVIAQTDLEHLDAAPGFERQRWAGILVTAVLDRYRLAHQLGDLWIYEPR